MRLNKKVVLITVFLIIIIFAGTAGSSYYLDNIKPPAVSPRQVTEQYFKALHDQDYKAAYAMISRQHYPDSFNQFIDRVSMYSPTMELEVQEEIIENGKAVVNMKIFLPTEFGSYNSLTSMDLVRVNREWKIVHP